MTRAQAAEMLNTFAYTHAGFGMLKKGSGNSCPLQGTFISCDILIYGPTIVHYDVASGADFDADAGASNMQPVWNSDGPCVLSDSSGCQMGNFLKPFPPAESPQVTSPAAPNSPQPTPTTGMDPEVRTFINAAAGAMDSMQGKLDSGLSKLDAMLALMASLQGQIAALPAQQTVPTSTGAIKFPVYSGTFLGQKFTLTPQKP